MKYLICALIVGISLNLFSQSRSIDTEVDSILNLMTLDEKIGQMTQAERGALENINDIANYGIGSLLSGGGSAPTPNNPQAWANMYNQYQSVALNSRLGIPLIYGIDAVHGHNNVYGAVIFPHNIGLGCTWNYQLVKQVNEITAKEVAATGIDWSFSPCIAVPRNERWGRTYEGFGETAEIQQLMSEAAVVGLQGTDLSNGQTILACAKHFVGDGGTTNGIDQGNTQVSEEILRNVHMPGYIDAIEAGVGSIMASYNSWNGQKLHGHQYLLTDVLKNELGFEGFIVSDWKGVDQVNEDYREAVKRSINAGIDMVMVPDRYIYFMSILRSLVESNEVSMERIDDAVRRILKQKLLLNLFEEPMADQTLLPVVGSDEHRDVARQAVRESLVLLEAKNNVLPLDKNNNKIMVAGRLANDLGALCGGWSISWQGGNGNITLGTSLLEGMQNTNESSEIIYSYNGNYNGEVDMAVVVIGEDPYAEGAGDKTSLNISADQVEMVRSIKEKGIPVITVIVSGRPLIIGDILPYTDAVIAAWLPGTEGDGIAQVLFGDYNPKGKLSCTWPADMSQIPINYGDTDYKPLFEYKHGLQEFPTTGNSVNLMPYAAIAEESGSSIKLALTDKITMLTYQPNDFIIKINNIEMIDNVVGVSVSEYDESVLILELEEPVSKNDENVTVSYTGDGILSNELSLISFSNMFVYNDVTDFNGTNTIPGVVQAEDYFDMSGIQTEPCNDVGGGLNVGYIEPGDWMKYSIDVLESGTYNIRGRISGYSSGNLSFSFNDTVTANMNYGTTNGWQSWQNFYTTVKLYQGSYTMKATANNNSFNINYFDFDLISSVDDVKSLISEVDLYPNPIESEFKLEISTTNNTEATIKVYNMAGIPVQSLYKGKLLAGNNAFNFILDTEIASGLYFIEVKDDVKRYFKRFVKK